MKPATLIAAVDSNHNGKEEVARRLVEAAIASGCDAIKFQKRSPEQPTVAFELPDDAFRRIREEARDKITFIGAPFDEASLAFLEDCGVDLLKVDPPHSLNLPLLKAISRLKKRLLISLTYCAEKDLELLTDLFRGQDLVLIHEVPLRPTRPEASRLGYLRDLRKYELPVGYSDRGNEWITSVAARCLGAVVLEKGLTLCRELPGPHHASSLEPDEMRAFAQGIRALEHSLISDGPRRIFFEEWESFDEEGIGLAARRDIRAGETITEEMLSVQSPPRGLTPRFMKEIIGRKVLYDIQQDEPITFGLIDL